MRSITGRVQRSQINRPAGSETSDAPRRAAGSRVSAFVVFTSDASSTCSTTPTSTVFTLNSVSVVPSENVTFDARILPLIAIDRAVNTVALTRHSLPSSTVGNWNAPERS